MQGIRLEGNGKREWGRDVINQHGNSSSRHWFVPSHKQAIRKLHADIPSSPWKDNGHTVIVSNTFHLHSIHGERTVKVESGRVVYLWNTTGSKNWIEHIVIDEQWSNHCETDPPNRTIEGRIAYRVHTALYKRRGTEEEDGCASLSTEMWRNPFHRVKQQIEWTQKRVVKKDNPVISVEWTSYTVRDETWTEGHTPSCEMKTGQQQCYCSEDTSLCIKTRRSSIVSP